MDSDDVCITEVSDFIKPQNEYSGLRALIFMHIRDASQLLKGKRRRLLYSSHIIVIHVDGQGIHRCGKSGNNVTYRC